VSAIRNTLVARLAALPAVAALIGDRIYPLRARRISELDYLVYDVAAVPVNHSTGAAGDQESTVTITCYGKTYDRAAALAAAVRGDESNDPSGLSGWIDADGRVWHCTSEGDDVEPVMPGRDEVEAFSIIQEFFV
jgi:hypothetical protein